MILSEFFWASPKDRRARSGGREVSSQQERGLAYRNYVEQSAALGFVIGIDGLCSSIRRRRGAGSVNTTAKATTLALQRGRPALEDMLAEMMKITMASTNCRRQTPAVCVGRWAVQSEVRFQGLRGFFPT